MTDHGVIRCLRLADEVERWGDGCERQAPAQIADYWRSLSVYFWQPNREPSAAPMYPAPVLAAVA